IPRTLVSRLRCGVNVSSETAKSYEKGSNAQIYTYLQVKEDGLSLFGFATLAEKSMFLNLISVSGVGCKVAQAILSGIAVNDLAAAIYSGNTATLTKIKGLGKKTAERLVLELREKVSCADGIGSAVEERRFGKDANDAISILKSLGLNIQDAEQRVETVQKLGAQTTEEIVNMALKIS
ncbi:MAG: Holliday junction branch migration protein RuvA, partial [Corallococcus sp.]|nr:Holliday junction branch migration protein RuvA [Corallococcus sp.]